MAQGPCIGASLVLRHAKIDVPVQCASPNILSILGGNGKYVEEKTTAKFKKNLDRRCPIIITTAFLIVFYSTLPLSRDICTLKKKLKLVKYAC
jgi:hypothetical protein